jgi:uncharacterized protein YecE (DUF72 family)
MNVWIGTAGYSYSNWVGPFYPPGTRTTGMLGHYARHFPVVELNFTFYRCPTPAMLSRLAGQTPPGFSFAVKLPRSLSHERRHDDLFAFREAVQALQAQGRLAELVCQLPQSSHNDPATRAWLERLARELRGLPLGVEFRHVSWARREVVPWLRTHRLDLIAVDVPDVPALYPRGPAWSGKRFYARLHSRNAGNWYGEGGIRYDYGYGDEELREWVAGLRAAAATCEDAYLVFNNCKTTQAVDNARRMGELLRSEAPELRVMPPFAAVPSAQASLFE